MDSAAMAGTIRVSVGWSSTEADIAQFAEALLNLGHALKAQGRNEEAKSFWRQAINVKPELAKGYFE